MTAFHGLLSKDFNQWDKLPGYQLRYIYFIDSSAKERLTVPILPCSKIDEMGARMYKGIPASVVEKQNATPSSVEMAVQT